MWLYHHPIMYLDLTDVQEKGIATMLMQAQVNPLLMNTTFLLRFDESSLMRVRTKKAREALTGLPLPGDGGEHRRIARRNSSPPALMASKKAKRKVPKPVPYTK